LDHGKDIKKKAADGEILFGTVNSYLILNLTQGRVHATDHTNASRTLMLNLKSLEWDKELLRLFDIRGDPAPSAADHAAYGEAVLGKHRIPILSSIGDQQGSLRPGRVSFRAIWRSHTAPADFWYSIPAIKCPHGQIF
jgi:glycerol kinase